MSNTPAKDFGPIADDYAFFENHATEALEDLRAYCECLQKIGQGDGKIRMLDFGCGSGTFTARFLHEAGWSPKRLQLTLIEPVEAARRAAVARVESMTAEPIVAWDALPLEIVDRYDIILANHVLYYVPDLRNQLARLIGLLSPRGVFTTAIAGHANALIEFWKVGFRLLGSAIPYNVSEDVESTLCDLAVGFDKRSVDYQLEFADTEDNRMHIVRFLLADYLPQIPRQPLLDLFDRYSNSGHIEIRTTSDHFTIEASARR